MTEQIKIVDSENMKVISSKKYNAFFDKKTGFSARWGKTEEDDPEMAPYPEILDIEVSEICHGINGVPCKFCYKGNTGVGKNMSFETFKTIMDKMSLDDGKGGRIYPLTQIAFGAGDIDSNPDLWKMMEYCREIGIVPNLTINGWNLTDEYAENLKRLCRAVSVSRYEPKKVCYDAVKKLTDLGMTQINIHQLVASETADKCLQVLEDAKDDPRLEKLNAIVFLMLKPKNRGANFTKISEEKYQEIIKTGFDLGVRIGFDSCSASAFQRAIFDRDDYEQIVQMVDACESTLFSSYINVDGRMFFCSFTEGEPGWEGIDVVNCENFFKDVWYGEETRKFRKQLLKSRCEMTGCRKCPIFDLDFKDEKTAVLS